ncbi:hypothetical protein Pint_05773 [Pistacia integerrima]|uniref:Uncharacterized protein n=1 Tax=Pistacia integerrima TaxID=434235 RepID=A0ACC0Z516_9ROSI|nr:hypothetical protein Pint_05773 [Pistacia integerrima]
MELPYPLPTARLLVQCRSHSRYSKLSFSF